MAMLVARFSVRSRVRPEPTEGAEKKEKPSSTGLAFVASCSVFANLPMWTATGPPLCA